MTLFSAGRQGSGDDLLDMSDRYLSLSFRISPKINTIASTIHGKNLTSPSTERFGHVVGHVEEHDEHDDRDEMPKNHGAEGAHSSQAHEITCDASHERSRAPKGEEYQSPKPKAQSPMAPKGATMLLWRSAVRRIRSIVPTIILFGSSLHRREQPTDKLLAVG